MCTLALYFRLFEDFPLIVAANRDEHYDRPSAAPSLIETTPKIIAGRDLRAGGTWLGVNAAGLMVGVLNRHFDGNSTAADRRSRGLLCMDLLRCSSSAAAEVFMENHQVRYNPFSLLCADRNDAFVSYNDEQKIISQKLPAGLHVFSSAAEFDLHSAKAERAYALFGDAKIRARLGRGDLSHAVAGLQGVLADHSLAPGSDNPGDAICVHRDSSGTVSSSIVFFAEPQSRFVTFYCAGAPCRNSFGAGPTLVVQ
ncbi:MAG: NRDE family protein [Candidatus Binatia bacterium]